MTFQSSIDKAKLLLDVAEEVTSIGSFCWWIDDNSLEWSDGLLKTFGVSREQFSGQPDEFFRRVHPEDQASIMATIDEAARRNELFQNTERIIRADGEMRWLHTRGRTLFDDNGKPECVVGICQDVTESINQAAQFREHVDTRRQLEQQLQQMQKLQSLGKLTSGVAHDFNNLLTVIQSACDLLEGLPENKPGSPFAEYVGLIHEANHRANQLTRQLLQRSRSTKHQPKIIDLNCAVRDAEQFLRRTIGKAVSVEVSTASQPLPVRIDPTHLQQILMNLALNARDAMPRGGTLWISTDIDKDQPIETAPFQRRARYAILEVSDSGHGIDPGIRHQIFDPYFTTKEDSRGTGLGLSVVQGIVRSAGGQISTATSAQGGATFRVRLPIRQERQNGNLPTAAEAPPGNTEPTGSHTILLVDDEAAVLRVISAVLERAGYKVIARDDPLEAL